MFLNFSAPCSAAHPLMMTRNRDASQLISLDHPRSHFYEFRVRDGSEFVTLGKKDTVTQNTFFGSNDFWSVTEHPLGSLDFSENAPTVYKYSLICGSRGSLAHNHAGWQRLHGSSVHQKAQICRSDFEICRCISKLQLAQNGKYFLILICNLVLYSKFRGTSLLRRLRMPFVFFY